MLDAFVAAASPIWATLGACSVRIAAVIVTSTLPIPDHRLLDELTALSIAPTLSQAIREVFTDGSVTRMFE